MAEEKKRSRGRPRIHPVVKYPGRPRKNPQKQYRARQSRGTLDSKKQSTRILMTFDEDLFCDLYQYADTPQSKARPKYKVQDVIRLALSHAVYGKHRKEIMEAVRNREYLDRPRNMPYWNSAGDLVDESLFYDDDVPIEFSDDEDEPIIFEDVEDEIL